MTLAEALEDRSFEQHIKAIDLDECAGVPSQGSALFNAIMTSPSFPAAGPAGLARTSERADRGGRFPPARPGHISATSSRR